MYPAHKIGHRIIWAYKSETFRGMSEIEIELDFLEGKANFEVPKPRKSGKHSFQQCASGKIEKLDR